MKRNKGFVNKKDKNMISKRKWLFILLATIAVFVGGCKSTPPISVTFRRSLLYSSTLVMQVTNRSGSETLVMKLSVSNKRHHQHKEYIFKVKPGDTEEIGVLEMDWSFESGEI